MEKGRPRRGEEIGTEEAFSSLGHFFSWLEGKICPASDFREHMAKSRVECLKGIKSLIDNCIDTRIDKLEKRYPKKAEKKATQVKVE